MSKELSIVVPTYNEIGNIEPLIEALQTSLDGISWEVIFVDDDSSDNTSGKVREFAQRDPRVRCVQRINRRGLSSACIEGILASSAPYVAVMDADMQHDESILPQMLTSLKNEDVDLVIGTRYSKGGSTGDLASHRVYVSIIATYISRLVLNRPISDPMSGFFMLHRNYFENIMRKLSGKGFKILLDIIVSSTKNVNIKEIPYVMRTRTHGESKLSMVVVWDFVSLILYKLLGRLFPARFISFVIVGFTGVFVQLVTLFLLFKILQLNFFVAQTLATMVAMTSNYIINNIFTYHDRTLHGMDFVKGLFSFYLACSLGAIINVAVANMLFEKALTWWISSTIGAVAGAVWNYATTAIFTWKEKE